MDDMNCIASQTGIKQQQLETRVKVLKPGPGAEHRGLEHYGSIKHQGCLPQKCPALYLPMPITSIMPYLQSLLSNWLPSSPQIPKDYPHPILTI